MPGQTSNQSTDFCFARPGASAEGRPPRLVQSRNFVQHFVGRALQYQGRQLSLCFALPGSPYLALVLSLSLSQSFSVSAFPFEMKGVNETDALE